MKIRTDHSRPLALRERRWNFTTIFR